MQFACAIFSSVACPGLKIFRHYFINGAIFENKLLNIKCRFDFLYKLFLRDFSL